MDFQNAALLVAVVYGLTELGKALLGKLALNSRVTVLLAVVVGQAAVWLVGTTAWAHEQVIGTKPLDELNTGSKILVGLFAAGAAAFGDKALHAVRNIGDNEPMSIEKIRANIAAEPDVHTADTPLAHPEYAFDQDA